MLGCIAFAVCHDLHVRLTHVCARDTCFYDVTSIAIVKSMHGRLTLNMHASDFQNGECRKHFEQQDLPEHKA